MAGNSPRFVPQALELDRRNVDAHVARGAALANQKHWPLAVTALETALGRVHLLNVVLLHIPAVLHDPARHHPSVSLSNTCILSLVSPPLIPMSKRLNFSCRWD